MCCTSGSLPRNTLVRTSVSLNLLRGPVFVLIVIRCMGRGGQPHASPLAGPVIWCRYRRPSPRQSLLPVSS